MFGKLAIISGCDGAKHPQYAIAPQSIHNKVSEQVDSKVILGIVFPIPNKGLVRPLENFWKPF